MMTSTGISETNKEILEGKYGTSWAVTPENRAFLGARQQCEQPTHPRYSYAGAHGIRFGYDNIDDFLADVGFRPEGTFKLERIDMTKNFEPGNVRWSPSSVIHRKSRPTMRVDRTLSLLMARIILVLKRQPNMEMPRTKLQQSFDTSNWGGATVFHEAVQQLNKLGFVDYKIIEQTKIERDGQNPESTKRVTRTVPIVRLIQEMKQGVEHGTT